MNPLSILSKASIFIFCFTFFFLFTVNAQTSYFFGDEHEFDDQIITPYEYLGYEIGSQHSLHANVVNYFKTLAKASDKITVQEIGKTYENRPLIIATITSKNNHDNLEVIRNNHLALCDPGKNNEVDISAAPVIINLGYNVHGNEPSSTEAAMLMAYYLVASKNAKVTEFLDNAVILMDPVLNPDGRDRHSTWVNAHLGSPPVSDPLDREHNETWPGGRTNHYWFDLNRDWLPLVHPESKARINFYHRWLPNILTDFHEMGTNATYFFEPTKPYGSENPIVPREHYDKLNGLLADYFASALDSLGSLYFTKEVFDNSYPGYGSTYPDVHGGVGLVFEQASSRGHLQRSTTGELAFAFTIKNHLNTSIATVKAGVENKLTFLDFQKRFFESSLKEGSNDPVKAYIFGDRFDVNKTYEFLHLLQQHNIVCYGLQKDETIQGQQYEMGKAFWVPTAQAQYKMVQTMFERNTAFYDSIFYDASAWALVYSYGLPHAEIRSRSIQMGQKVNSKPDIKTNKVSKAGYSYVIDWKDNNAPKALHALLKDKIIVKAAFRPFSIEDVNGKPIDLGYGSLIVPVAQQTVSADQLHEKMLAIVEDANIEILAVNSGRSTRGIDLGSNNFKTIKQPKILMLVGEGVSSYEAGEVWHLLDQRLAMPITKVDLYDFNRVVLANYDRLVMVSGNYSVLSAKNIEKIKAWTNDGGTLVTIRNASRWAINNKIADEKIISDLGNNNDKKQVTNTRIDYAKANDFYGAQAIGGSIYKGNLDITHPLGFGYSSRNIWVYRNSKVFLEPSQNVFSTVIKYEASPLVSGYVSDSNLKTISNSASLLVSKKGRGRVILFADNPNFRGTWLGTNKLFLNALFFGNYINIP